MYCLQISSTGLDFTSRLWVGAACSDKSVAGNDHLMLLAHSSHYHYTLVSVYFLAISGIRQKEQRNMQDDRTQWAVRTKSSVEFLLLAHTLRCAKLWSRGSSPPSCEIPKVMKFCGNLSRSYFEGELVWLGWSKSTCPACLKQQDLIVLKQHLLGVILRL